MPSVNSVMQQPISSNRVTGTQSQEALSPSVRQTKDRLEMSPMTPTQDEAKDMNCFIRCLKSLYEFILRCLLCRSQNTNLDMQTVTTTQKPDNQTPPPGIQITTTPVEEPDSNGSLQIQNTDVEVNRHPMKQLFPKEWAKKTVAFASVEELKAFGIKLKQGGTPKNERFFRYYLETTWYQALCWNAEHFKRLEPDIKAQFFCDLVRATPTDPKSTELYLDTVRRYALELGPKLDEILQAYGSLEKFIEAVRFQNDRG